MNRAREPIGERRTKRECTQSKENNNLNNLNFGPYATVAATANIVHISRCMCIVFVCMHKLNTLNLNFISVVDF